METDYTLSIFPMEGFFGKNVYFCESKKYYDFVDVYHGVREFIGKLKKEYEELPQETRDDMGRIYIHVYVKKSRDAAMLTELMEVKMKNFKREEVAICAHFTKGIDLYY